MSVSFDIDLTSFVPSIVKDIKTTFKEIHFLWKHFGNDDEKDQKQSEEKKLKMTGLKFLTSGPFLGMNPQYGPDRNIIW